MCEPSELRRIAFLGDYLPRKCGIATFTHDLYRAVATEYPDCECTVIPIDDIPGGYDYGPEVRFQIPEQELDAYRRAADYLNFNDYDVVCMQHEFGIYGGPSGSHVLALLRDLRMPVVTTLHTVLDKPSTEQRRVMDQLAYRSARMVVMSERGKQFLEEIYKIPAEKIDVIPHGIPDMPFVDPNFYKDQFGVDGKNVILTFGLLSPNKGIEYALRAMPAVLEEFPDTVYIVLGATHPNLVRDHGETYRHSLQRMTQDLGIQKNVIFYDRFVELHELIEFIGAADLYVTPYLNPAQITSGTLAYSFGSGKAVISTPYWHAEELLADERGVLVPFADSEALSREIRTLLREDSLRHAMRKKAYLLGREMVWSRSAQRFMESFQSARRTHAGGTPLRATVKTLDQRQPELPRLRLEHLFRMTDSTGIFQHAVYGIPNYREGYCTDDNARALLLAVLLEELGEDDLELQRVTTTYAAFLNSAFDPETKLWRNFMGFDRNWLEECGSQDSLGRAIWTLGTCVGRSKRRDLQFWAARLFEGALRAVVETTSPRTWAFALLGIHEYLRRLNGDRLANQVRDTLTQRLIDLFHERATDDWPWFEETVTYCNARLSHALILSGRWTSNSAAMDVGLRSLRWLSQIQRAPKGHFRPIGSRGFYSRGGTPAEFDQQPIEAGSMVSAALEAYRGTDDPFWLDQARLAFEWFLGRNDTGLPLCDSRTGGCYDGLHEDRVNQNQGAESTLAWLLALTEMKLLETSLAAFEKATDADRNWRSFVSAESTHVLTN